MRKFKAINANAHAARRLRPTRSVIKTLDTEAFANNIDFLRNELIPKNSKLCIAFKCDAYGHGIEKLAPIAASANKADYIGIVDNWEAELIRDKLDLHNIKLIRLRPALVDEVLESVDCGWNIEETLG